jgi:hypothetical protein
VRLWTQDDELRIGEFWHRNLHSVGAASLAAATTAPFAAECQSFLDNVVAGFGQTGYWIMG